MPRKPVLRELPDLAVQFADFKGFADREVRGARLTQLLRTCIEEVRQPQEQPFYPVAVVAAHFGVSTKTVSECYRRLAGEGLLRILRGSKTLVRGRRLQPQHPILGVVGVPVYLPGFIIGSELRAFYIHLERALRRYHFVADFLFFKHDDQFSPDLAERVCEHELDVLLWINPSLANRPTIQTALDGGICVALCVDGRGPLPRQQYLYDFRPAIAEAVKTWVRQGIRSVCVWHDTPQGVPCAQFPLLLELLEHHQLPVTVRRLTGEQAVCEVEAAIRHPDCAVVLPTHRGYESLANRYPELMQRLFASSRVLLMQGPLYHPSYLGGSLRADVIAMPYEAMAERIARDIGEGRADTTGHLATFHARFDPRLPLGTVSRGI